MADPYDRQQASERESERERDRLHHATELLTRGRVSLSVSVSCVTSRKRPVSLAMPKTRWKHVETAIEDEARLTEQLRSRGTPKHGGGSPERPPLKRHKNVRF